MSHFYAIDGESYTKGDDHKYVLLAGSDGRTSDHLYDKNGISTEECFKWLLDKGGRRRILVCFGLNYDANMMFRDIPRSRLKQLHKTNSVYWRDYFIEYVSRKWLYIKNTKTGKSVKVYEVFGFFQTSFIKALKAWNLEPPREIIEGKQLRSDFTAAQFRQILSYCIRECELLVQLMIALRNAMTSVDIYPRTWNGAGSVAAALLGQVHPFHKHDSEHPPEVFQSILHGYFGGRVELYKQGEFPTIHNYDVISAYPAAIANLPDLSDGEWKRAKTFSPAHPGLWLVSWKRTPGPITPFPVRHKKQIYYPTTGDGWYHTEEVAAAIDAGFNIKVKRGFTYHPATTRKPFDFVPELFEYRRTLKQRGHAGEKAVKLGLNSVYGKLAQGQGYKGQLPRYQSYFWAGQVTAWTRAKLLRAIMSNPDAMVMVATDGIFSAEPLDIELGDCLGDWESTLYTEMFTAQPGVYRAFSEGEEIKKSRGFFAREVDYDELVRAWREEREYASYRYESTRFIGLGTALMRTDLAAWRKWVVEQRKIVLYPNRRSVGPDEGFYISHLPMGRICTLSEPYIPKSSELDADILREIVQGHEQPLAAEV